MSWRSLSWTLVALGGAALGQEPVLPDHPAAIPVRPLAPYTPPRPRTIVLPEGPRVLLLTDRALPLVDGVLAFPVGIAHEPESQAGLVELLVDALRSGGSENAPGRALDRWLDARAATIEVFADLDRIEVRFSCLSEDLEALLGHVGDLLRAPAYPERAVASAQRRKAARTERRRQDPAARADDALRMLAYGTTPATATEADGSELGRQQLLAFHRTELTLDRLLIGISGDVDADSLPAWLSSALAGIARSTPDLRPDPPGLHFIQPARTRIHVVDRPDAPRTELRIAGPGTRRLDPDATALDLWSEVLGADGTTNRINVRLQTELGLSETVRASFQPDWTRSGRFEMTCSITTESAPAALAAALDVLREGLDPIAPGELESARTRLENAELFRYQSSTDVMRSGLELALFDYPEDYWAQRASELRELQPDDVSAAVRRHLAPDRLLIVVVGPADALLPELEPLGDVKIFDPDLALRSGPTQPQPVEKMFAALGGREHWARLVAIEADVTVLVDGREIRTRQWHHVRQPQLRVDYQLDDEPVTTILDRDRLWARRGPVIDTLSADQHAQQLRAKRHSLWEILHRLALADGIFASVDEAGVLTITDPFGLEVELELDANQRPARMRFDDDGTRTEFTFDSWALRDGYSYATLIQASPAEREWRVTRFRSLASFDPELLFER